MSPHLLRIEDAGPDRKARRLVFDDGSEPRLTSAAAVKTLGLVEGDEISSPDAETALLQVEPSLAKERALQLLGYRDRSSVELARKLGDSGYQQDAVRPIVERFIELGLVDDKRFAEAWVRTRVASGYGSRRIARELAKKGVAASIAETALHTECPEEQRLNMAVRALRGSVGSDRKARDRLVRRLVAKGYELGIALQAVDQVSAASEDGSGD